MIYFLSDLHGDVNFSGLKNYLDIASENDLLIILGDIGIRFEDTEENNVFTDYFLSTDKQIAFIDGNHENFEYLNSLAEEEWNGGKVGRLTKNIVHLKRGNVFTVEDKKFFVFGGCKSSPKWKEQGLWHFGEEPSEAELTLAYENLKKHDYSFDYILTHKYEQTPGNGTVSKALQKLTEFIDNNVQFKKWYAGHWHMSGKFDEKHIFIYDKLTPID